MTAITLRRSPSRVLRVMEQFASDIWESETSVVCDTCLLPSLDMYEEKDELVTKVELPGMRKEDIDISLDNGCLTIKAEKKQEEVSEEKTYYACERSFGSYSRSVSLPFSVDADEISATFENGLLEIRLPKAEEAKAKHIEIKVEERGK